MPPMDADLGDERPEVHPGGLDRPAGRLEEGVPCVERLHGQGFRWRADKRDGRHRKSRDRSRSGASRSTVCPPVSVSKDSPSTWRTS